MTGFYQVFRSAIKFSRYTSGDLLLSFAECIELLIRHSLFFLLHFPDKILEILYTFSWYCFVYDSNKICFCFVFLQIFIKSIKIYFSLINLHRWTQVMFFLSTKRLNDIYHISDIRIWCILFFKAYFFVTQSQKPEQLWSSKTSF